MPEGFTLAGFAEGDLLGAGESLTLTIQPEAGLAAGSYDGALTLTGSSGDEKTEAALPLTYSVEKADYRLGFSLESISFGTVAEGDAAPAARTAELENTGNLPLTLKLTLPEGFVVEGIAEGATLEAGKTVTLTIRPKDGLAAKSYDGTLIVEGFAGDSAVVKSELRLTYTVTAKTDTPDDSTGGDFDVSDGTPSGGGSTGGGSTGGGSTGANTGTNTGSGSAGGSNSLSSSSSSNSSGSSSSSTGTGSADEDEESAGGESAPATGGETGAEGDDSAPVDEPTGGGVSSGSGFSFSILWILLLLALLLLIAILILLRRRGANQDQEKK